MDGNKHGGLRLSESMSIVEGIHSAMQSRLTFAVLDQGSKALFQKLDDYERYKTAKKVVVASLMMWTCRKIPYIYQNQYKSPYMFFHGCQLASACAFQGIRTILH